MLTKTLNPQDKDVIEPLIAQARCSIRDRIVVAGTRSAELMFELHRRGYLPCGDDGKLCGRQRGI